MSLPRRDFLASCLLAGLGARGASAWQARPGGAPGVVKPKRLAPGATVGLVSPASATWNGEEIAILQESLAALGLKSKLGPHALDRYGYLAGADVDRAADLNAMFKDGGIDAILCIRGGWGSNRLLDLLDYGAIAANPKILVGYSDITSLLLAIHAHTGLVTYHGPVGASGWNAFSVDHLRRLLFQGEPLVLENPKVVGDALTVARDRIQTLTPGTATGRLVGGNLTVLAAMMGSGHLPDWRGKLLFLEDINEEIYRIDRMLTQLKLAGVLAKVAGVVFGKCTKCGPGEGHGSLTLDEVLRDHLQPLKVPVYSGAMIGHIDAKFTVPVGILARMDADRGTLTLLEPAVR